MEIKLNSTDNDLYVTFDSAMNILDEIQRLRKENNNLYGKYVTNKLLIVEAQRFIKDHIYYDCDCNNEVLAEDEIRKLKKIAKGRKSNKNLANNNYYSICPFLNNSNRCDIYDERPSICRSYTCEKFIIHNFSGIDITKKYYIVDVRGEIFNEQN